MAFASNPGWSRSVSTGHPNSTAPVRPSRSSTLPANSRSSSRAPTKDRFVALDQKCTHGGGALTYVHKHQHLYCTCWGHAKFALDGSVLRWPNQQTPRPLRAYAVERKDSLLEIRVEGLA